MKIYVGFDDTDTINCGRGTGKLARRFGEELPKECEMLGVVRQQLLVSPDIPYTSHNSSLCCIIESESVQIKDILIEKAIKHINNNFFDGSDPGLCVVDEKSKDRTTLIEHGINCIKMKVSQKEALIACKNSHLSGHGGSNDGIIGAAAAIGLTLLGESGRFIEFGKNKKLRDYKEFTTVKELKENGIKVISVDRNSKLPNDDDIVNNKGWLRPRLVFGQAVLPILQCGEKSYETINKNK